MDNQTIYWIEKFFSDFGSSNYYGENVSQYEHAAQCALLAIQNTTCQETQIAAFLHDIGHFLPDVQTDSMSELGNVNHEKVAAEWLLSHRFSHKIASIVENHVFAKRYLCTTNPAYYSSLSDASKITLQFQGGLLNEYEQAEFQKHPFFSESLQVRHWDDQAKVVGMKLPNIHFFLSICKQYLIQ